MEIILVILLILCIYLFFKNDNTYKNHLLITEAIHKYKMHCISNDKPIYVDYAFMENYKITLLRLSDWGYEHILPSGKMALLRPYID